MRRLLIWLSVTVFLLVLLGAGTFRLVNARILPGALDRVSDRLAESCDCQVNVAGARLGLSGAVELTNIQLAGALLPGTPEATLRLGTLRLENSFRGWWRLFSRLRGEGQRAEGAELAAGLRSARAAVRHGYPGLGLWALAEGVSAGGLSPPHSVAHDISFSIPGRALRWREVSLSHRSASDTLLIQAEGEGSPVLSGTMEADYRRREGRGELRLSGVDLRPFSGEGAEIQEGRASLEGRFRIDGLRIPELDMQLLLEDLNVRAPILTEEPVGPLDISYSFTGAYDPAARPRDRLRPAAEQDAPGIPRRPGGGRGLYGLGASPLVPSVMLPRGLLRIHEGEFRFNGVALETRGEVRGVSRTLAGGAARGGGEAIPSRAGHPAYLPPVIDLRVTLPETPVQEIHRALPEAVLGPLSSLELEGSFAWDAALLIPPERPGNSAWAATPQLRDFRVLSIAEGVSPYGLNEAFVYTIRDPVTGYSRQLRIPAVRPGAPGPDLSAADDPLPIGPTADGPAAAGPQPDGPGIDAASDRAGQGAPSDRSGNPGQGKGYRYVRFEDMSPWIPRAVLTAEDGDFYYHRGVNFLTLAQAVERNLRAGEIEVGASTLSMQLVKMLLLDGRQLFARKLQEVFLVFLMEHQVPVAKDRIFEIYLNIAEFGPGVFGVDHAARYYFDRDPAELSVGEATWLASVLPSPKRYHWYYENGAISQAWFTRMKAYYGIMLERDRMTPEQYERAVERKPVFAYERSDG